MIRRAVLSFAFLLTATQASASPIPYDVIQKEYESCMTGQSGQDSLGPEKRQAYCACTTSKLGTIWSLESFAEFTQRASTGDVPTEDMNKLQAIASECFMKTVNTR